MCGIVGFGDFTKNSEKQILVKKTIFDNYGGYNTSFKTGQDLELWLRLKDKIKFGYTHEVLLKYRLKPNSVRIGIYDNSCKNPISIWLIP